MTETFSIALLLFAMTSLAPKTATDVLVSKDDPTITAEISRLKAGTVSLEADMRDLQSKQDVWDQRYLDLVIAVVIFGTLGALLGGFTFLAQKNSSNLAHRIRDKSGTLADNNNRISVLEKGQSDERIAQAKLLASTADNRAAETARENIKLKGGLDLETARAKEQAEELHKQNLATEATLEDERATRLKLEKSLAPRRLSLGDSYIKETGKNVSTVEALKEYVGTEVILESFPDAEAKRAAGQLVFALQAAGWKLLRWTSAENLQDGVLVRFYHPPHDQPMPAIRGPEDVLRRDEQLKQKNRDTDTMWAEAKKADAVVKYLTDNNWLADATFSKPGELQPGILKIEVGLKPVPYFDDTVNKVTMEQLDKAVKEDERKRHVDSAHPQ